MCEECEERDIRRHDKREATYCHKAGSILYLANHVKFCMGRKVVFVLGICGLLKN